MIIRAACLAFFMCLASIYAEPVKEFVVLRSRNDAGMFAICNDVIALLACYERGDYAGVQVDFGKVGYYYDENQGDNWWEYYFEPIFLGQKAAKATYLVERPDQIQPFDPERHISPQEANALIKKYVHLKPHVAAQVDEFVQTNFAGKIVLGVHYRGTDKAASVAPCIPYSEMAAQVRKFVNLIRELDYTIFVATDEQPFLDYFIAEFPGRVCFVADTVRSTNRAPLHFEASDPYRAGEGAILDCVILSHADFLIRTSSNLSLWSTFFNPRLAAFEISRKNVGTKLLNKGGCG